MPPPRIGRAGAPVAVTAGGATSVVGAIAAGSVAAVVVRHGLLLAQPPLPMEGLESLLQLAVAIAAALAAFLLAPQAGSDAGDAAPVKVEAKAAAAAVSEAVTEEAVAAAGAFDDDDGGDEDEEDDGSLDESAAPIAPAQFVAACRGDAAKAQRRWDATRAWRRAEGIDRLLFRPNTTIEQVERHYPYFLHGRGIQGEVVMYEMAGRMDMASLKAEGLGGADLARHSTYMQEFMWEVLSHGDPNARGLTVMDMGGMSLHRLSSPDTAELIRATSGVLDAHYPNRIARILVVNAPGWVASAWALIAALMPQSLRDRVKVTHSLEELQEYIHPSQLPLAYGGTDPTPPGHSPEMQLLHEIVAGVRRGGTRPPALRAVRDRRRAAKKAAALEGAMPAVASPGVTAAGADDGEQGAAPRSVPARVAAGGHVRHRSSPMPASWHAAGGAGGVGSGGKPPRPSPLSPRGWWRGAGGSKEQQPAAGRPLSASLTGAGAAAATPTKKRKGLFLIPSSSPPSSTGSGKGFWRRRSKTPAPRVEAPEPQALAAPSPAS